MSNDVLDANPPREGSRFRATIGLIAVLGGLAIVIALLFVEVPTGNRDALMLALGIVLGWGATIVGFEFGSSPAGRKAAEAGIKPQPEASVLGTTETQP